MSTRRGVAISIGVAVVSTALVAVGYHFGFARFGARARRRLRALRISRRWIPTLWRTPTFGAARVTVAAALLSVASNTQEDADYAGFVRATGFDYGRDLDRFVLVSRKGSSGAPSEVIVVGEGHFDEKKIRAYALANGTLERRGSKEVFLVKSDTPGKIIAMTFLGANRIAISNSGSLDAILSSGRGGQTQRGGRIRLAAPSRRRFRQRGRRSRRDSRAWPACASFIVWRTRNLPPNFAPGGIQSQQTERSDSIHALGRPHRGATTDKLRLRIEGECETPDQAATLAGALTTLHLIADGMLGSENTKKNLDPQLLAFWRQLLDSAEIAHNDRWASLSLDLSRDFLQYIAQHMKQAPAAAPAVHPVPPTK